jgi:hypothetical protein
MSLSRRLVGYAGRIHRIVVAASPAVGATMLAKYRRGALMVSMQSTKVQAAQE